MNLKFEIVFSLALVCFLSSAAMPQGGEEIFKTRCVVCHTIGKGQLVGPDLKGSTDLFPEKWLVQWIKSSQAMVEKKDAKAIELFTKFNEIVMPDNLDLSDAEIKSVIAYIKAESGGAPATAKADAAKPGETAVASGDAPAVAKSAETPVTNAVASEPKTAIHSEPGSASDNTGIFSGVSTITWVFATFCLFFVVVVFILFRIIRQLTVLVANQQEKGK